MCLFAGIPGPGSPHELPFPLLARRSGGHRCSAGNNVGPEGARALAEVLKANPALRGLELDGVRPFGVVDVFVLLHSAVLGMNALQQGDEERGGVRSLLGTHPGGGGWLCCTLYGSFGFAPTPTCPQGCDVP